MRSDPRQFASTVLIVLLLGLIVPLPARQTAEASASGVPVSADFYLALDSITVDGLTRTFAYRVPPAGPTGAPVVLALHGGGGSADRLRMFMGETLEESAARLGMLVAYPNGIGGSWNDCRAGAPYLANVQAIDDVRFMRELVEHLSAQLGADRRRVFVLGLSNGGHLALRLAVEAPDLVAGAAAFAATWPSAGASDCGIPRRRPAPVMLVNGTADPLSPWSGGMSRGPDGTELGEVMSADATAGWLRKLAGYRDPQPVAPDRQIEGPEGLDVHVRRWSAPALPELVQITVYGGGHAVPGSRIAMPESVLGPIARNFDGVREALAFFLRQTDG